MKSDFALSISKPCSANWNEMTPNEQGKFCGHCSLTVVDFTKMHEAEIKEYFRCHYGQKTCGRFETNQLSNQPITIQRRWDSLISKIELYYRKSHLRTATLSFLTILAFLASCRKPASHTPRMGKVHIMGDTMYIEKVDTIKATPLPEKTIK